MRDLTRGRRSAGSALLALGLATCAVTASLGSPASSTTTDVRAVAAPSGLSGLGGFEMAHLTWQKVTGASSYRIYRAEVAGGPWTRVTTPDPVKAGMFDVPGLTNGTTTYLAVTALRDGRQSARSAAVAVTPAPTYALGPGIDAVGYLGAGYPGSTYPVFAASSSGDQVVFVPGGTAHHDIVSGRTRSLPLSYVHDLALSADGRWVVANYFALDRALGEGYQRSALVNTKTKDVTILDRDPDNRVMLGEEQSVAIDDAGRRVAYEARPDGGPIEQDARVLDRVTGTTYSFVAQAGVSKPEGVRLLVDGIDLSADGTTLAVRTNATIDGVACGQYQLCAAVWDLASGVVRGVPLAGPAWLGWHSGLALNGDGSVLASSNGELNVVRLGPVAGADQLAWSEAGLHVDTDDGGYPDRDFSAVAITPDGSAVAYWTTRTEMDSAGAVDAIGTFHVHDLDAGVTRSLVVPANDLPKGSDRNDTPGWGASFGDDGRYAFAVVTTKPGAVPGDDPKRRDVVRWEWALTAPDA